MEGSILEASQKSRRNGIIGLLKNKKFYIPVIVVLIAVGAWFVFGDKEEAKTQTSIVKEFTAKHEDLKISIESDGKVVAEDGVELSFSVSGDSLEVIDVYVKQGDAVKKGDKIAAVDTDTLAMSVQTAYASYQSTLADYNEDIAGATDEEIRKAEQSIESAELSLKQAKLSLEDTKAGVADRIKAAEDALKQAKEDYEENISIYNSKEVRDDYEDLIDNIMTVNITLEGIISDSDEILGVDKEFLNDAFEENLGTKNLSTLSNAVKTYNQLSKKNDELESALVGLTRDSDYVQIDNAIDLAAETLDIAADHAYDMYLMLENTITSVNLSQTTLDGFISGANSDRTAINTKISSLNSLIGILEDTKDSVPDYKEDYDDAVEDLADAKSEGERDIVNAETNIKNKEFSLENAQADYDELLEPLSDSELASLRSRLTSASISLQKAQNELDKAVLTSPIDGELAYLNYKKGDIILKDDSEPVAVIINNDTLFIEVNIEEADINDIEVGQKAYVTFDALDELTIEGEVSFISLTSSTNNNGIVTYLVKVMFAKPENVKIREGMTAYVDFIKAEAGNVLVVPVDAVRNVDGSPSVQLVSGEWVKVVTGFTDGDNVEIISGLSEGDKVYY